MLSQGQFFDPGEYDIKTHQMDFDQFSRTADYWHGSRTHKRFNEQREGIVHAGSRGAAEHRLRLTHAKPESRLFPLHHVGEMGEELEDRGRWNWSSARLRNVDQSVTHPYENKVEAAGTTSVVGPPSNFLSYRTMVRSMSPQQRSPVQEAEMRAGHEFVQWRESKKSAPAPSSALSYELAGGTKGPLPSAASKFA